MSETALVHTPARPTSVSQFAGFDAATYHALRESIGAGAPVPEFKAHLLLCQRLGLNPVGGQVHLVPRKVRAKKASGWVEEERWTTQIGIDGFRSLAEDHGDYDGSDEPEFQYEMGGEWTTEVDVDRLPYAARFTVYRKSIGRPIMARAHWQQFASVRTFEKEFVEEKDGKKVKVMRTVTEPQAMWKKMPHHMLAKCAEAQALRKAFPRVLGGLYAPEEMPRAGVIEGQATQIAEKANTASLPEGRARVEGEKFDPASVSTGAHGEGEEITEGSLVEADAEAGGAVISEEEPA